MVGIVCRFDKKSVFLQSINKQIEVIINKQFEKQLIRT